MIIREAEREEFRQAASQTSPTTSSLLQAALPLKPSAAAALKKKSAIKLPSCVMSVKRILSDEGVGASPTSASRQGAHDGAASGGQTDESPTKRCRGAGEPSLEPSSAEKGKRLVAPIASLVAYADSDSEEEGTA